MHAININRVVVSGSLAREPQLHVLPRGESVCNLRVLCNARDAAAGEKLNYFDVKVYGDQAQIASHRMHKGRPVIVEGRLDWREWETVEGHSTQTISILADTLQFLDDPASANSSQLREIDWDGLLAAISV
jgi:single-strand DNA-binding protein